MLTEVYMYTKRYTNISVPINSDAYKIYQVGGTFLEIKGPTKE